MTVVNHASAAVQMLAQGLLFLTFLGYDHAAQATWQAAALWLVPLWGLWALWQKAAGGMALRKGRWVALLLLPCLWVDIAFALYAFSGFIAQIIPQYLPWVTVLAPMTLCAFAALWAKPRGVRYGSLVFKGLLVGLFVCGTLFLRASSRSDRLWPIFAKGWKVTGQTALMGAGSFWGAALYTLGPRAKKRGFFWALLPWAMCFLWALWYGFLRPWAVGDVLPVAEKLMGLARHASGVIVYELAGLMWLLLLPLAITGALSSAEALLQSAWPKSPRWIALLLPALPASALMLFWPGQALALLERTLPWRAVVSAAAGAALCILAKRENV